MTFVKFKQPITKSFDGFVDDLLNEIPTVFGKHFSGQFTGHAPVNITETNEAYKLELSVPGRNKEDFKVNIDRNLLTVSFEKKQEEVNENERSVRKEFSYESFSRSFTLDEKVDAENISAKYEYGILTLNLPKKEELKVSPKEIEIK